jgi:hypothetical protein
LQHKAAWHSTREQVRKEAFLLKQVKTLELWQGTLVHRAIELHVVPALQTNQEVNWAFVVDAAASMARRQMDFSATRRYREAGMTKTAAGDDYCALAGHELEVGVSSEDFERTVETVRTALTNLSTMDSLWQEVRGRGKYWAELEVRVDYDIAHVEAYIDLMFFSQLCWPVPDRCMRLSIDLKLCDDNLRSNAGATQEDEGQFGDDDDFDAEIEETQVAGRIR